MNPGSSGSVAAPNCGEVLKVERWRRRSGSPLAALSSWASAAPVKPCPATPAAAARVARAACANIDLKEAGAQERVGLEDPSALEHGLNAASVVRGRVFDVCPLALKVTCVPRFIFGI